MRIRRLSFGCVLAVSTLVAGCDKPSPTPAAIWRPTVGTCHDGFTFLLSQLAYEEMPCGEPHLYETFHVGTFTAATDEPPAAGSQEFKDKWAFCESQFGDYLGGDWRERMLRLRVAVPKAAAWHDGARWFLCAVTVWTLHGAVIRLARTMKDGFATMPELAYGCAEVPDSGFPTYSRRCDEPHNAEYVGHFPADPNQADPQALCSAAIYKFTGTIGVYGQWLIPAGRDDLELGDHHLRCFAVSDRYISKSVKAAPPT